MKRRIRSLALLALLGVAALLPRRSDLLADPATSATTSPPATTDAAASPDAAATPPAATTEAPPAGSPEGAVASEATPAPRPTSAPLPIDQLPYRVLVAVGIAPDPALAAQRTAIIQGLRERIASRLGPLWDAEVQLADWLSPGRQSVLESFSEADLNDRFLPGEFDKVFLAAVEGDGAGFRLSAREWDRNSQSATAVTSRLTYEPRVLIDRLLGEVLLHFRPMAAVESVSEDGQTVELRIRGGELLPPDPDLRPAVVGTYLRPYFRYLDRKRQLRQLQTIPWTYLQVTAIERGRMQAELTTAFPGILSGSRRRTELMAIAVKTRFEETSMRIHPRGQPENPMAAVRVDVLDRRPTEEDAVTDRLVLYTDRFGEVRIPANPERPLQYVYVLVGKGVLAMAPFIPGEHPSATLDVPDDSPRLLVEGEIAIMEAELIELVARREVTMARALGYARAGQWDQADPLVDEVKHLPTREMILERLERIRLPAIDSARRTRNRVAESRINQMCNQLREHIERHLNPDRLRAFLQEIAELKQAG